jgi:hypothetical protein
MAKSITREVGDTLLNPSVVHAFGERDAERSPGIRRVQ